MRKGLRYKSSDDVTYKVDDIYGVESPLVRLGMECRADITVPIDIHSTILSKVFDFSKKRAEIKILNFKDQNLTHLKLKDFDSEFLRQNQSHVVDLNLAALRLQVVSLFQLTINDVVDIITEKTSEEIRQIYHTDHGYDSEVVEGICRLSRWAFQPM